MRKYFLGCDPGKSGAYAIISDSYEIKKLSDFVSFTDFFSEVQSNAENLAFGVIELVHIFPGARADSSTTFMKNAGALEAILEILSIPRDLVQPQKWQKAILGAIEKTKTRGLEEKERKKINAAHKKRIKEISVLKANQRFGLSLKNNQDGLADALNMALYAMKYHTNQL